MNSILAEETGAGTFQTRIDTGDHSLLVDEPANYGGFGSGPSPFDLLCAALAACTLMTMKLYAKRKGWTLAEAERSQCLLERALRVLVSPRRRRALRHRPRSRPRSSRLPGTGREADAPR